MECIFRIASLLTVLAVVAKSIELRGKAEFICPMNRMEVQMRIGVHIDHPIGGVRCVPP